MISLVDLLKTEGEVGGLVLGESEVEEEEELDAKDGEKEQPGSKCELKEELGSKDVEMEGIIGEQEDETVTGVFFQQLSVF